VGFAKKKHCEVDSDTLHPSWYYQMENDKEDILLEELNRVMETDTSREIRLPDLDPSSGKVLGECRPRGLLSKLIRW
jgi:hypothetical protein